MMIDDQIRIHRALMARRYRPVRPHDGVWAVVVVGAWLIAVVCFVVAMQYGG